MNNPAYFHQNSNPYPNGGQPPYYQPNPPYSMPNPPNSYGNPPQYAPSSIYGGPGQMQNDIQGFSLLNRGNGIDNNEFYVITHSANDALSAKEDPLSDGVIKRIKAQIGGEWMTFASVEGLKGYDFSLSIVAGNDFLSFIIRGFRFQVCRLRD